MNRRILIIEDDDAQRQLFKTTLEQAGYEVVTASNGEMGVQYFRQQPCDLVITDIFMPGKTGFETIFALKTESPAVKVIAISGGAVWAHGGDVWARYYGTLEADNALKVAHQFGADYILNKPIKLQNLVDTVDELLHVRDRRSYINLLERSSPPPSKNREKEQILVIEDDDSLRQLFKTALEHAGYEVVEASDGETGVEMFCQESCSLAIIDIFMPKEDGIETIFDLKTQAPHLKIIAISGGGSWSQHGRDFGADDPLEMARRFGAVKTLKKPIKIQHLVNIINELLHKKH